MIDSINPTGLMEFATAVAVWVVNRQQGIDDELSQVKHSIHTFCVNNEDPIYRGVDVLCESAINVMIDVLNSDTKVEVTEEPKEEEAKEEDGEL